MSNAQLDALIAYAEAVNNLVDVLPPEAATPEVNEAIAEIRRRLDDLHRALVPGADERPHLTLVES